MSVAFETVNLNILFTRKSISYRVVETTVGAASIFSGWGEMLCILVWCCKIQDLISLCPNFYLFVFNFLTYRLSPILIVVQQKKAMMDF